jgi:hypothetical protein
MMDPGQLTRPTPRSLQRFGAVSTLALVLAVAVTVLAVPVGHRASAQSDDATDDSTGEPTVLADGEIEMTLIDQRFDLAPGGEIELTYRLTGDLEAVAELVPPTTTTTTTSTTTTTTTTTTSTTPAPESGDSPAAPPPAAPPPAAPPTSAPPPETTVMPPEPLALSVAVANYAPVDDLTTLLRIVGPDAPPRRLLPPNIDGVLIADVRPDITITSNDGTSNDGTSNDGTESAVLRLSIPTDQAPSEADLLEFNDDGLHPLIVELKVADQVVASHATVVDRRDPRDDRVPPIDLAPLAAITDPGPNGTLAEIEAGIERLDALASVALELDTSLTLDVPPNIARLATEASTANNLPDALDDDELIAAPATPFDISSAAAVNRVDAFVRQLASGQDLLEAALPSTDVRRNVWLVTSPISTDAATVLRDLGVRYLVMTPDLFAQSISDVAPSTDRFVEIDLRDGATMPILLIDDLGAAFTREASDAILAERSATEWAIETLATIRLQQYTAPFSERDDERSRIIATPDFGPFDMRLLSELERLSSTTDAIRFTPATELVGVTERQGVDADLQFPEAAGPSLAERLERIALTQLGLESVASMLPDDDERPSRWNRELDSFVSTAYEDQQVDAAIDGIVAEADAIRSGIVPPEPISFTLTGNDGEIDLRIGNTRDEPLQVLLRLDSPRLTFPAGDQIVTLAADDVTTVKVPVVARTNGTSAVLVDLFTPDGQLRLTDTVTLTARVNALTGLGQVLTAGLALVLLTWWFSNWRSRRAARLEGTDTTS